MELQQPVKCPSCGKQMPGNMAFCPLDGHALAPVLPTEPRADPLLETQVSEYVIKERIGAGGMGIVYRAVQPLIGKQVAIKVLKAEYAGDADVVQRLLVEARVVNAIQHRGIIDIFGFGQLQDGRPYVVMELLHGTALSTYIRKRRKLGADEAVAILDEILAALAAAHKGGVIHRDLKPGNVFMVDGGDGVRSVKLLDFGIAKVLQFRPSRPLTAQGNILGTPEYMAPEQVRGEAVGPTTDLYALGIIAFQMLTGRLPFIGEPTGILLAQAEEAPPTPSSLVPEIPPALESLVLRLLAKEPSKRFPSAEVVRKELSSLGSKPTPPKTLTRSERGSRSLGTPTIEVPMLAVPTQMYDASTDETEPAPFEPTTAPRLQRPVRRRWLVGVGAAALVLSTGAVAFTAIHRAPEPPEKVAEAVPASPSPAPAQQAPGSSEFPPMKPVAHAVAPPSHPVEAPKPPASENKVRVEVARPKKLVKAVAPKPPPEAVATKASAPPAAPVASVPAHPTDQKALLARIADAEARMLKINPLICTNSSPAFAALKELEKQIRAAPQADQVKLADLLAAWEQKFLPKP